MNRPRGYHTKLRKSEKDKSVTTYMWNIKNNDINELIYKTEIDHTDFWTLWEKARVGCSERTASKHVYYQGLNRSPAQVGCMRQVLGAGALGRPRGMGWGGRWGGDRDEEYM